MANYELTQKFHQLENEINNSKESELIRNCQALFQIYNIFSKNFELLDEHLNSHSELYLNKQFAERSLNHRLDRSNYMRELDRLLHNFIASAKSLIDLSRKHYRNNYESKNLFPEYQEEIDTRFRHDPLSNFVQDLRNYFLHKKVPVIITQQVHDANKNIQELHLFFDKKALLETESDWTKASKRFLNDIDENESIQGVFASYFNKIIQFHEWYHKRQKEIWKKEFDWFNSKLEERSRVGIELGCAILEKRNKIDIPTIEHFFLRFLNKTEIHDYMNSSNNFEKKSILIQGISKLHAIPTELVERIQMEYI
ncbi:MAG: hypothetical protein HUJ25_17635 [Crocinitomicaceae bacterium]|nr:hypothetical protein [Crocinitomicaceae bacterium]